MFNYKEDYLVKYIFIHGLGQNSSSWIETVSFLNREKDILCPDLFSLIKTNEKNYDNLYASFAEYCNKISEPLNLCGLSLGGILALNYTIDCPQKINSLVLIGTQYKIPKIVFNIQTTIFKILPKSIFNKMGLQKRDIIELASSMKKLDFSNVLNKINCTSLIICGKKDKLNMKPAKYLTENIKNAKIKIIENTGHTINTENPKGLALELNEFYK